MSAHLARELAEIASELDVMADREDVNTGDFHGYADELRFRADELRARDRPPVSPLAGAVERVSNYLTYHDRMTRPDHIYGFGLGAGSANLLASDVRALLAQAKESVR